MLIRVPSRCRLRPSVAALVPGSSLISQSRGETAIPSWKPFFFTCWVSTPIRANAGWIALHPLLAVLQHGPLGR